MKAFPAQLQTRLTLEVLEPERPLRESFPSTERVGTVWLDPPNFRFEVVRQLIGADIEHAEPPSVEALVKKIGASPFTVRKVLGELVHRGVVKQSSPTNARFALTATAVNLELLGLMRALPQSLRFRYAAGTRPRSTGELLVRFEQLMQPDVPEGWKFMALSGAAVTNVRRHPHVDLLGVPRLDLTAYVGKSAKAFDVSLVRQLDSGLERVTDVHCSASLVITLVRSDIAFNHPDDVVPWHYAHNSDIYLALLDAGLREQSIQFAANGGKGDSDKRSTATR